jgi:hypothetical protein
MPLFECITQEKGSLPKKHLQGHTGPVGPGDLLALEAAWHDGKSALGWILPPPSSCAAWVGHFTPLGLKLHVVKGPMSLL